MIANGPSGKKDKSVKSKQLKGKQNKCTKSKIKKNIGTKSAQIVLDFLPSIVNIEEVQKKNFNDDRELLLTKELFGGQNVSFSEKTIKDDLEEETEENDSNPHPTITNKLTQTDDLLKAKYEEIHFRPKWALREASENQDTTSNKTATYLGNQKTLPKKRIHIEYCGILNGESRQEGPLIKSVDFNNNLNITLVAGTTKNLGVTTIFQFDGKQNNKIKSIKYERFPISSSKFMDCGTKIITVSNSYGKMWVYDITDSNKIEIPFTSHDINNKKVIVSPDDKTFAVMCSGGLIQIYSTTSLCRLEDLTLPCLTRDIAYDNEGSRIFAIGDIGRVFVIDVAEAMVTHSFYDDGCVEGFSIATSPNGKFLACGSNCGIVNIYELNSALASESPKPLKAFGSLVTPVTHLEFNCTSELLAMASSNKDNALKMVHVQSLQVFENFPRVNINYNRVNTLSFSPDSKYLCIGSNRGRVDNYRLLHY